MPKPRPSDEEAFLAQAVHDWRQPLQMALGHLELVLADGNALTVQQQASLKEALAALEQLGQGFAKVLEFARSGIVLEPSTVDLGDVAREATAQLAGVLRAAAAEVDVQPLPRVRGDALLLQRLLANLISNAVKYHGPDPVRIRVWGEADATHWRLHVADNGVGMSAAQVAALGRPFARHRPDMAPGVGLGLASCLRIARAHGGRMWAESQGTGTTIHVEGSTATAQTGPD